MNDRTMRIVFSSAINNLSEKNSSFDSGVLRVAYTGRNRNNSFISKETFERCMPSIYNCPIVCNYNREEDSIGAHDIDLVPTNNGGMKIINVTQPVGVIPESANYWWEEVDDDSGVHEYLCVDALIWKRQEAYQKIKDDGITDESMEISVKEGEIIDGVFHINRFEFTAFCLLGSAAPCFESASLELFSCDTMRQQLAEMMREFKETLNMTQSSKEVGIQSHNYSEEGGIVLEQKIALMAEFGLSAEALDFNIEDFSVDELREKFEAMKPATEQNFALEREFREELIKVLEAEEIETCYGTDSHYWFWDYDKDLSEVYAHDNCDHNLYGFSYSMDGDKVVIDFESKKRMKIAVEQFDEGAQAPQPFNPIEDLIAKITELVSVKNEPKEDEWESKFQIASETIASMENELGELRKFKTDAESLAAKVEREKVFVQFEDLSGIEAFETLRENCDKFSLDALEEKCYAIRGRNGMTAKFSSIQKSPKLVVEKSGEAAEPYGGIFAEYGIASGK